MTDISGFSLNRPTAQGTLRSKYGGNSQISPYLRSTSPLVQRALQNYDTNRANLGQSPLTNQQTVMAGRALSSFTPGLPLFPFLPSTPHATQATPAPDRPWWQDAASDVQQILTSVPKVPALLTQEGTYIPQIGTRISEALNKSSNPLETVGNLAQVPGLRLIPGAFVASQFGTGGQGVGGLTEHPVMSALDVLPYAEKAASLTKVASAAEDVAGRAADITGNLPRRTTPLGSVIKYGRFGGPEEITRRYYEPLKAAGEPVPALRPNLLGQGLEKVQRTLMGTGNPVGEVGAQLTSPLVRETARLQNRGTAGMESLLTNPDIPVTGITEGVTNPKINPDVVLAAAHSANNTIDMLGTFDDIPVPRRSEINRDLIDGTWQEAQAGYSPHELEYMGELRTLTDAYTNSVSIPSGKFMNVPYAHGNEIYDTKTGNRLMNARHTEDTHLAAVNLAETLNPQSAHLMSPDELHADFTRAMADDAISGAQKVALARGYTAALASQGVDVTAALDAIRGSTNKTTLGDLPNLIDPTAITPVTHTLESISAALEPLRQKSFPVNRFVTAMKRGDLETAVREVPAMKANRQVNDILTAQNIDLSRDLVRARDIQSLTNRGRTGLTREGFTTPKYNQAARIRTTLEARSVPARFQGALQREAIPRMREFVEQSNLSPEIRDRVLDQITSRLFKDAASELPGLRDVQREIRDSWQSLADQGLDPMFVSNVAPSKLSTAAYPQVGNAITHPQQFKTRLWDAGPTYQDVGVALYYNAAEILIEAGNRWFLESAIPKAFVRDLADLRNEFMPRAMELAERHPEVNVEGHLQDLILNKAGFEHFDPEAFITGKTPPPGTPPRGTMMIPSEVARALEKMRAKPGDLGQLMEGPMRIFRTSVLPLSPRWHVNNILGGSITTLARAENPLTLMKFIPRAWRLAREGGPETLHNLPDLTPEGRQALDLMAGSGETQQFSQYFRDRKNRTTSERLDIVNKVAVGRTLTRLWDQVQASKIGRGGQGLVQGSYNFNQLFDNFYRSLAYFEGEDRALNKGLSRTEQIKAGVQATRDVMQSWDTLTPMERGIMRMVFPFYSWTRFMMKYVMTYPGDHPWRTSILASLSRTEGNDYGTGIPQDLRSLLFFGEPDKDGKITGINTSSFNPFRDTANYFTLAGFLTGGGGNVSAITSQVNPAFGTLLSWAGVDTTSGMTDLYPELTYDPTTGRLTAMAKQNPILGAVGNFLPQVNALTAFAGINQQYRDLQARDPAAAARYLASTVGVPVLRRDVNLTGKIIGSEVTRYNTLKQDLTNALQAGDLSGFSSRYPTMNALSSRLNQLLTQPAFRQQYGIQSGFPGTYQPTAGDMAREVGKAALPIPIG